MSNEGETMPGKVIDIRSRVDEMKAEEQQLLEQADQDKKPGGSGGDITDGFVLDCLWANEYGDGELYAALLGDEYLFNSLKKCWMYKSGALWREDDLDYALAAIETVVAEYDTLRQSLLKQKDSPCPQRCTCPACKLRGRVSKLRSDKGRNACLKFARSCEHSLAISGYEFDTEPTLLGFPNGVLDITTGQLLKGGTPALISKSVIAPWVDIEAPAPLWEKSLKDILDNQRVIDFMQRFYGYSMLGEVRERAFLVCDGRGQNGKGLISEMIQYVLHDYAVTLDPNMLIQSKFSVKSSAGPSPDIMSLLGARLAVASETSEGQKFDIGKVKLLSGGEKIVGRNIQGKKMEKFTPSHTLVLLTNHIPRADASDYAFWSRFHRIPFPYSFVSEPVKSFEKKADRQLDKKLREEASGILAWLVRGFLQYQEMGLCPPDEVKQAIEEQRDEENYIKEWLQQRCDLDGDYRMLLEDLYSNFHDWYKEDTGSEYVPTKNKFGRLLVSEGFEKKKDEKGRRVYVGLRTKI